MASGSAHAGAWTQPAGSGQAIVTGSYYATDRYFDNNGAKHAQPTYSKYELNPYMEYGLRDDLTVGANLSLQRVHQDAGALPGQNNWGLGDSSFFLRKRLWQHNGLVISAEPMLKLPSPEGAGAYPRLGGSSPDAGIGLNGGYGFRAYGLDHFADLDTQYRHRFGTPHDQINLAATLGLGLSPRWMLMPQAFVTYRTVNPRNAAFTESTADDYNMIKLQLSALYKLTDDVTVQAGGFGVASGKNTGSGGGALLGMWTHF